MSVVTLSLEVELGWGVHDTGDYERISPDRRAETTYFRRLLDECERVDVPFSFDVVGHLLHETCTGSHESPHAPGWFADDPGTDVRTDPKFYAPDMVDAVRESSVDHEICTHSYSHVTCEHTSDAAIEWDLAAAQRVHEDVLGERTVSFVPPKHEQPPFDVLERTGIEIIRMHRPQELSLPRKAKRLALGPHPLFESELVDGVVVSPCTTYPSLTSSLLPSGQGETHPAFRYLPLDAGTRRRLHVRYLRNAVERALASGTPVHLWSHLNDLANEHQLAAVREFLDTLARYRDDTDLEVLTMRELNDRIRNRKGANGDDGTEGRTATDTVGGDDDRRGGNVRV